MPRALASASRLSQRRLLSCGCAGSRLYPALRAKSTVSPQCAAPAKGLPRHLVPKLQLGDVKLCGKLRCNDSKLELCQPLHSQAGAWERETS